MNRPSRTRGVLGAALEHLGVLPRRSESVSLRGQTRLVDGFTITVPGAICLDFAKHMHDEMAKSMRRIRLCGIQLGEDLASAWTWTHGDQRP